MFEGQESRLRGFEMTLVILSRRKLVTSLAVAAMSGVVGACSTSGATNRLALASQPDPNSDTAEGRQGNAVTPRSSQLDAMYAAVDDDGFHIPEVPYERMDAAYLRQEVASPFAEKPGSVVVDTGNRFLYFIEPDGRAIRYGVGIGRQGFSWTGQAIIQWKRHWPRWYPPAEMIARDPRLTRYSVANGGMSPGLRNALGSRAMYIFRNGKDTLYRLHGTQEWESIGKAVSSGCVRILNQDVIDLYERVQPGAMIKVI